MLLNALMSPEGAEEVLGKSLYVMRAGPVAGTFLYAVGIMAGVIFLFALMRSLRVTESTSQK
jgi:hypothetical protein